jgi:hypothetical protein
MPPRRSAKHGAVDYITSKVYYAGRGALLLKQKFQFDYLAAFRSTCVLPKHAQRQRPASRSHHTHTHPVLALGLYLHALPLVDAQVNLVRLRSNTVLARNTMG